ncbi:hypothetical protein Sango_1898300 [Sesamum angolense]|uniref:Uncharacterized protein n=1 Tax=Sesamum angolense TaxID=2727404 RepID=A0AAE1WJ02_9LAMI|nr:hypothetical protein Sango_1898300 [Sesamum angolense]
MSNSAKFLKEMLSNKRKWKGGETMKLNEECSTILQNKLPPKLKDPWSFSIPCTKGNIYFNQALCDLGPSANLMPYSILEKFRLHELTPTIITLQLAAPSPPRSTTMKPSSPVIAGVAVARHASFSQPHSCRASSSSTSHHHRQFRRLQHLRNRAPPPSLMDTPGPSRSQCRIRKTKVTLSTESDLGGNLHLCSRHHQRSDDIGTWCVVVIQEWMWKGHGGSFSISHTTRRKRVSSSANAVNATNHSMPQSNTSGALTNDDRATLAPVLTDDQWATFLSMFK